MINLFRWIVPVEHVLSMSTMNNYNSYPGAELNGDADNFFDFEAASSNTPCASTHNSLGQPVHAGKWIHDVPLRESEVEVILAMRASNAQNSHQSDSLAPPELNTNFFGPEESRAYGACFNYDGAEIPTSANLNDFDMPDYGNNLNLPPNLDGSRTFEQAQFEEEPADVFGALNDYAPNPADQLR